MYSRLVISLRSLALMSPINYSIGLPHPHVQPYYLIYSHTRPYTDIQADKGLVSYISLRCNVCLIVFSLLLLFLIRFLEAKTFSHSISFKFSGIMFLTPSTSFDFGEDESECHFPLLLFYLELKGLEVYREVLSSGSEVSIYISPC